MNLKTRFYTQNILAIVIAIIMTALFSMLFVWGYTEVNRATVIDPKQSDMTLPMVLFEGEQALFSNRDFDRVDLQKMLIATQMEKGMIEYDGVSYLVKSSQVSLENGHRGTLVHLIPLNHFDSRQVFVVFIFIFFVCSFFIANLIVVQSFTKRVIRPILTLKECANKLIEGDLSNEIPELGDGEVRVLSVALEELRLKQKQSIYLHKKEDENRKFIISTISHDLKTPVTSIRGYIQGILDGVANTEEKVNHYLHIALQKSEQLNRMIDDLFLYVKLDFGQLPFHFERVDIGEYIYETIAPYHLLFQQAEKTLTFENQLKSLKLILIDRERFGRVIQNIVDNAMKHTKQGGHLHLGIRETHSAVLIEFKDDGEGIEAKDLPHVFERFYKADISRRNDGSTGLGLAIAKQIVEGHHGKIWAVSQEAQGTSIMISFKKERIS